MTATTSSRSQVFSLEEIRDNLCLNSSGLDYGWSFEFFPCDIRIFEVIAHATFFGTLTSGTTDFDALRQKEFLQTQQTRRDLGIVWYHLAESYRLAAILYVNELFDLCSGSHEMDTLIDAILSHARAVPLDTNWAQLLCWPLFQVGLESRFDCTVQDNLMEYFRWVETITGCRHGKNAARALRAVWATEIRFPRTKAASNVLEGQLVLV